MSDRSAPRFLIDYLRLSEEFLRGKEVESPRLDAEILLAEALGLTRIELYTNHDRPLRTEEVDRYRELLRRRASREPVHYIVGRREFWSLEFEVDRRVLIPRPETELLVELAAALFGERSAQGGDSDRLALAADVGTGSGAVAVALAKEVAGLQVVASDLSAAAIEVAPRNALRHGVADRVEFLHGDLFEPFAGRGPFDAIVSNPPYVKTEEYAGLPPEVRNWEPATALVAEEDGVEVTRRLVEQAPLWLAAEGWLFVEVGTQAVEVGAIFERTAWRDVCFHNDLAGHRRVVAGRRPVG